MEENIEDLKNIIIYLLQKILKLKQKNKQLNYYLNKEVDV